MRDDIRTAEPNAPTTLRPPVLSRTTPRTPGIELPRSSGWPAPVVSRPTSPAEPDTTDARPQDQGAVEATSEPAVAGDEAVFVFGGDEDGEWLILPDDTGDETETASPEPEALASVEGEGRESVDAAVEALPEAGGFVDTEAAGGALPDAAAGEADTLGWGELGPLTVAPADASADDGTGDVGADNEFSIDVIDAATGEEAVGEVPADEAAIEISVELDGADGSLAPAEDLVGGIGVAAEMELSAEIIGEIPVEGVAPPEPEHDAGFDVSLDVGEEGDGAPVEGLVADEVAAADPEAAQGVDADEAAEPADIPGLVVAVEIGSEELDVSPVEGLVPEDDEAGEAQAAEEWGAGEVVAATDEAHVAEPEIPVHVVDEADGADTLESAVADSDGLEAALIQPDELPETAGGTDANAVDSDTVDSDTADSDIENEIVAEPVALDIAERLEELARALRESGTRGVAERTASADRLEAVLAAVVAGYLAGVEGPERR